MSIASRIEQIEQHISDDYSILALGGADLTNVDKNILNLKTAWQERLLYFMNNGTDVVWNNWDKVTGEGTTLTLNNTEEAPMKIDLKGNTSQVQYTGKNLFNYIDNLQTPYRGLTSTINGDGSITTTGIPQYDYTSIIAYDISSSLENGARYTLSQSTLQAYKLYLQINIVDLNGGATQYASLMNTTSVSFTADTTNKKYIINLQTGPIANWGSSSLTITNYYQLEKGSSATSFEPYVGGIPSPNPNYPQDIHIVSGDNSINVVGKNLFEPTTKVNGTNIIVANGSVVLNDDEYTLTATGTDCYFGQVLSSGGSYIDNRGKLINVEGMSEITFTITNASFNNNFITAYNSSKVSLGYTQFNSNIGTYTIPSNAKYITIRFGLTAVAGNSYSTKVQIEKGSVSTEYEKHIGNTYPINLPVENLFDGEMEQGSFNSETGAEFATNTRVRSANYITLSSGKYTISVNNNSNYKVVVYVYDLSGTYIKAESIIGWQNLSYTLTLNNNRKIRIAIKYSSEANITPSDVSNIQLEKGSKANSYTPYGTTPIELCKIGDYQDIIKKSTGKNLFDKNTIIEGKYIDDSGNLVNDSSNFVGNYIKIDNTKSYYVYANTDSAKRIAYYDSTQTFISRELITSNGGSLTVPNNASYVRLSCYNADLDSLQLEKGTSHTSFEPYGTGWYVKKEIGKVVLDGTNVAFTGKSSSSNNNQFYTNAISNIKKPSNNSTETKTYSSHFSSTYANYLYLNNVLGLAIDIVGQINCGFKLGGNITTYAQANTWLQSNNVKVNYPLATPTYTEITGELLSQLNALARSYTSQTNISQESNDSPFIINATALKEME